MLGILAQVVGGPFVKPTFDWHALAPELVLAGAACVVILLDSVLLERARPIIPAVAGLGFLAPLIPLLTLATNENPSRSLFGGAYVVDRTSLVLKALFLVVGYLVTLLATNYVAEGDYWESEFYALMLCSVLGMTVMASARDLISIFVALELLSIPAYMLAGWRKRDSRSNEAGLKYYLMGVFASAILLYGMSLIYGFTNATRLDAIAASLGEAPNSPVVVLGIVFVLVGFGFKVSAVPFHQWAPDTYEGAPTPVTAFLAVASKSAGFVALIQVVYFGFLPREDITRPILFVLSALSMTVGNLIALRQTNVVRMLAYSGIAQAGFMLAPLAMAGQTGTDSLRSLVHYLVIYAAMNLGAFAVVIAVARKTRSGEIASFGGLFEYAPGLCVAMTVFLASLVGIPPLGGWFAKFGVSKTLVDAHNGWGYSLAGLVAVNTAVAAYYYMNVAKVMWFDPVPDGDRTPIRVPVSLISAIAIALVAVVLTGVLPQLLSGLTESVPQIARGGLPR